MGAPAATLLSHVAIGVDEERGASLALFFERLMDAKAATADACEQAKEAAGIPTGAQGA